MEANQSIIQSAKTELQSYDIRKIGFKSSNRAATPRAATISFALVPIHEVPSAASTTPLDNGRAVSKNEIVNNFYRGMGAFSGAFDWLNGDRLCGQYLLCIQIWSTNVHQQSELKVFSASNLESLSWFL